MVKVYSKPNCPQCVDTKTMLNSLGIKFEEIDMSKDVSVVQKLRSMGYRSAPVVVTEDDSWTGFKRDKIQSLNSSNLDELDSVFA